MSLLRYFGMGWMRDVLQSIRTFFIDASRETPVPPRDDAPLPPVKRRHYRAIADVVVPIEARRSKGPSIGQRRHEKRRARIHDFRGRT